MAHAKYGGYRDPEKVEKPKISATEKAEVQSKADQLIETVLKPTHIKPPDPGSNFNYIADFKSKWIGSSFYMISIYNCPAENAIAPSFESKFARLEYAGNNRYHLSFMRHTGSWVNLLAEATLDDCMGSIEDDPWFHS